MEKIEKVNTEGIGQLQNLNGNVITEIESKKGSTLCILNETELYKLFDFAIISLDEFQASEDDNLTIGDFYCSIYNYYGYYDLGQIDDFLKKNTLNNEFQLKYSYISNYLKRAEYELVPFENLLTNIEKEFDEIEQNKLIFEFEIKLEELFKKYDFRITEYSGEEELTIGDIYFINSRSYIEINIGINVLGLHNIGYRLQKLRFENNFNKKVGSIDFGLLNKQREKYGAKGANLEILNNIFESICNLNYKLHDIFYVPDFERISTDIFSRWESGESIIEELDQFYNWINGRYIIIRSSAVNSEDGENITGAGIYNSIEFDGKLGIEEFEKVIVNVYESINSHEAIEYRKDNGIVYEKMGIVLQVFQKEENLEKDDGVSFIREKGYINTVVKGIPELIDIALESGMRPVMKKEESYTSLFNLIDDDGLFHYELDYYKCENIELLKSIGLFSLMLEKYYTKPIQIEFLINEFYNENYCSTKKIALLQTRYLPKNYSDVKTVEFPKYEAILEGRALGIGDLEMEILPNWDNNNDKEGIVIFEGSKCVSLGHNVKPYNFPNKGAVIVLGKSNNNAGHIETLAAERGLLLIFNTDYHIDKLGGEWTATREVNGIGIEEIDGYDKLHIVMDGLVGKVYKQKKIS